MAGRVCEVCDSATKYQCLRCSISICNNCSTFEDNEDIEGWKPGAAVGYCDDCLTLSRPSEETIPAINDDLDNKKTIAGKDADSTKEGQQNKYDESDDCQSELDESPNLETKKKNKPGRKGIWTDEILGDFIDIIASDDYFKRKLIFTNTKNQQNGLIYQKILTELKKRCQERREVFDCTISQARNKFKKCISECKKAALTQKTATGVQRFVVDKGYGSWFSQLFQMVKCRDSCQPDQAIEPSTSSTDNASNLDTSDEAGESSVPKKRKQFVPVKTKKAKYEDILKTTNELVKKTLENDKTDKMLQFMKDEFEQSRQHELKLFQMLFNSMNNAESQSTSVPSQGQAPVSIGYHQQPIIPEPNIWTNSYPGNSNGNLNHSFIAPSQVVQPMSISSAFLSQVARSTEEDMNKSFESDTHYHRL